MAVTWDAKAVAMHNLALVHTRCDEVREAIEDSGIHTMPYGTAYIIHIEETRKLMDYLYGLGYVVEVDV